SPLLFYSHRHTLPLHSFPTRRSSDLSWKASGKTRNNAPFTRRQNFDLALARRIESGARHARDSDFPPRSPLHANSFLTSNVRTRDRKSTRLNSSHDQISYAVFCLKKK